MKEFKSIVEVKKYFNLKSNNREDLKKEIKGLMKEIHSRKSGDIFDSKEDETRYLELNEGLRFLNWPSELVTREEITSLTKIIKDLAVIKDINSQETSLSSKVDSNIKSYVSSHRFPKISLSSISGLLSILWLFPRTITEHEVLSEIINIHSKEFTITWLVSLGFTAYIWLILNSLERKSKHLAKQIKLESTQTLIFNSFISKSLYNESRIKDNKFVFDKEELMGFIRHFDIRKKEFDYKRSRLEIRTPSTLVGSYDYRSDNELVQNLADTIINKALSKEVINIENQKSISDLYSIEMNEEQQNYYRQHFV